MALVAQKLSDVVTSEQLEQARQTSISSPIIEDVFLDRNVGVPEYNVPALLNAVLQTKLVNDTVLRAANTLLLAKITALKDNGVTDSYIISNRRGYFSRSTLVMCLSAKKRNGLVDYCLAIYYASWSVDWKAVLLGGLSGVASSMVAGFPLTYAVVAGVLGGDVVKQLFFEDNKKINAQITVDFVKLMVKQGFAVVEGDSVALITSASTVSQ